MKDSIIIEQGSQANAILPSDSLGPFSGKGCRAVLKVPSWFAAVTLLLGVLIMPAIADLTYTFDHIVEPADGPDELANGAVGEAQLFVDVGPYDANRVLFTFRNTGPQACAITDVYFDDGVLLQIAEIVDADTGGDPNVDFSQDAKPGELPAGGLLLPPFVTTDGFSADSDSPVQSNGVGPNESLGIVFSLDGDSGLAEVLDELATGYLRIGIHVQSFADGDSQSFVNNGPNVVQYTVTATAGPGGSVDPNGVIDVNSGDCITFEATPDTCYEVDTWYLDGNDLGVSDSNYTLCVTADHTLHVTFKKLQYTLASNVTGCGWIQRDPNKATYACGETVQLTAIACPGWMFSGWSQDLSGSANPETILIDGNKQVTATFTQIQYTLDITIVGDGTVTKVPDKSTYTHGETVELTANPGTGWMFSGWSQDLSGSANPETILIDGNKQVTATFREPGCGECDGQTYEWTNAYPWSYLWVSPWNWEPIAPYGGPGIADTVVIGTGLDPVPEGPVLDTDIDICRIYGPAQQAPGDQMMYVIKDANVLVCKNWIVQGTVPYTGTILIADDAKVSVGSADDFSFHAHGDHQRVIINMTDNARMTMECDMRVGDGGDDYFELNMTDNAYLYAGDRCDDGFSQNEGELHVNISGSAILEAEYIRHRCRTDDVTSTWSISDSAQVIVTGQDDDVSFQVAGGSSTVVMDITDNGMLQTAYNLMLGEDDDFSSTLTLNMPCPGNQLVDIGGDLRFFDQECDGFVTINLDGGVINVGGTIDWYENLQDQWVINMCCDGVLILAGDQVALILDLVEAANIVPCPQLDCRGEIVARGAIMVDYDNVNPGKTTVWSEVVPAAAWSPLPLDGATDVPCQGTSLCWCLGEPEGGVKDQFVWFSTDCDAVANRNPAAFLGQAGTDECVELPCLALSTTYCWAVDTLDHYGNTTRGPVWSFTVTHCTMIEDFESYVREPWNLIWKSWFDGCGYWVGDQLVGNGTGSCVSLEMSNTHDGAQAMVYTYENDYVALWERDHNYSEACRTFDPALDLECCDDKALVIYFYGDADNDLTDMWVKLSDGVTTVKSTYGANGEDPANIQVAEWQDWNTKMSDFATIDLSSVTGMSIGFGNDVTNVPDGAYGMVLFDDIQSCATRCVTQFLPECFGDHNGDCVVDWKDIKIIADNWLTDLR